MVLAVGAAPPAPAHGAGGVLRIAPATLGDAGRDEARTGREPGMKTIFLNVGRKQLVTPADIVRIMNPSRWAATGSTAGCSAVAD